MTELPLHPSFAHLPLGLAFLLPMLGLGVMFAITRAWLPRNGWLVVVIVSALGFSTSLAARSTGETEEHRVRTGCNGVPVPRGLIHEHEEAAEAFVIALGVATLLSAAALFLRRETPFRVALAVISLGYFGVLGAGLNVGRLGGDLVYRHGAGAVGTGAADGGTPAPSSVPEREHREHDDDD